LCDARGVSDVELNVFVDASASVHLEAPQW
jgi:hypothetical protein